MKKEIYCCGCQRKILATLVSGKTVYPSRADLKNKKFWQCDCGLFVGTHDNSKLFAPLGVIATPEIKKERQNIHLILDRIWKEGFLSKRVIYEKISNKLGYPYHTGYIRSLDEAVRVYKIINKIFVQNNEKGS